ncbi:sensor histidine kinase [Spirosoma montaniterrae]|uniref:Histidine kinase n=1 Tax=Spirosoma montaniterrae TaxID=1178516 RepID=A0A1P9WZA3_9BACT|nr:histidine kinase [Spirosoma montaniterrae]AQG80705.1 histidine kinase [Spirosoma montaniterrae]
MEPVAYTLNDRTMRLIGIPVCSVLVPTINHFDKLQSGNPAFLTYLLLSFCTTLFLWEGHRFIMLWMRKLFPAYQQTTRRLLVQAGLALLYTLVVTYVLDEILCRGILHDPKLANTDLLVGFRVSLIPTAVVYLLYEAIYFFNAWKQNIRKTEALAREGIQSQLEVLKNQLDPHFLFNSLNTLAALIDDQNIDAQLYLERLSDVYRYVLVSRNKNTVPLEEEMAFLDAYVYLNKIRFRDNLQVEKQLDPSAYHQCITPLSLQMLIENAIKHNIVSKENPLIIRIFQEGNQYLVVENNVQEKTILRHTDPRNADRASSTRVGLQNIINRYQLLTDRHVEVIRTGGLFRVKLPLLTN